MSHTVINARNGAVLLTGATSAQYDRWYDHHCFWRMPRSIEEVNPELRPTYQGPDSIDSEGNDIHFLVEDGA